MINPFQFDPCKHLLQTPFEYIKPYTEVPNRYLPSRHVLVSYVDSTENLLSILNSAPYYDVPTFMSEYINMMIQLGIYNINLRYAQPVSG